MKQKLCMFAISPNRYKHSTDIYPKTLEPNDIQPLDESKPMKSAYFTIYPGKNPPPQNGWWLKSVFVWKNTIFTSSTFPIQPDFHKTNRTPLHYIPVLPGHWSGCLLACTGVQKWSSEVKILRDSMHACQKFLGIPSSWSCQACWDQSSSATWGSIEHSRESEVMTLGMDSCVF